MCGRSMGARARGVAGSRRVCTLQLFVSVVAGLATLRVWVLRTAEVLVAYDLKQYSNGTIDS